MRPYARVDFIPQSGTLDLASENTRLIFLSRIKVQFSIVAKLQYMPVHIRPRISYHVCVNSRVFVYLSLATKQFSNLGQKMSVQYMYVYVGELLAQQHAPWQLSICKIQCFPTGLAPQPTVHKVIYREIQIIKVNKYK